MTNPGHDQSAFARLLADADELLRLPVRAARVFAEQSVASFRSLADLIDAVLPADASAEGRLARAIQMPVDLLRDLRSREVDPLRVPQRPLATLVRAMGVEDEEVFAALLRFDHEAFAVASGGGMFRGTSADIDEAESLSEARAAWRSLELDDPSHLTDEDPSQV